MKNFLYIFLFGFVSAILFMFRKSSNTFNIKNVENKIKYLKEKLEEEEKLRKEIENEKNNNIPPSDFFNNRK